MKPKEIQIRLWANNHRTCLVHPLVFTTGATAAPVCNKFHKRVVELIAKKCKELHSHTWTQISFAMLESIMVSIHGVRDRCERKDNGVKNPSEVAFGLIPMKIVMNTDDMFTILNYYFVVFSFC